MTRTPRHAAWAGFLALSLSVLPAGAAPPGAAEPAGSETTPRAGTESAAIGALAPRLESGVRALFDTGLAPGMQVAVVKDGAVVYAQAFGLADVETGRPVDLGTQFYIASTTKALTALAAQRLASEGRVDLDEPISTYLPRLRLQEPLSPTGITLRDLLTHTHGISNDGPVAFRCAFTGQYTRDLLLDLLRLHPASGKGRQFAYGNIGYNLAGLVLEAATKGDWRNLVDREVLRPAGMTRTTAWVSRASKNLAMPHHIGEGGFHRVPFVKDDATMSAAGGHLSTALDFARFLEAELDGGSIDGRQVFPRHDIEETQRLQATQDRSYADYHRYGWGLGWDLGTYGADTLFHRFGSFFDAYFSHVSFMPHRGLGVVVFTNDATTGGRLATMVANSIYDRLLEKPGAAETWDAASAEARERAAAARRQVAEDRARRAARPQETAHPLAAYAGSYESPAYGRMVWARKGDRLRVSMGALVSEAEVYDGAEDQWRVELAGGGEVVTFEFTGDRPSALTYHGVRFERR